MIYLILLSLPIVLAAYPPASCVWGFTRVTGARGAHLMLLLLLSHTRMHGPSNPDRYCKCCTPLKPCQHRALSGKCKKVLICNIMNMMLKWTEGCLECFGLLHYFYKLFLFNMFFAYYFLIICLHTSFKKVNCRSITGNLFI